MSNVLRPVWRSVLNPTHGATNDPPVPFVPVVFVAPVAAFRLPVIFCVIGSPLSSVRMPLSPNPPQVVRLVVEAADEPVAPVVVRRRHVASGRW